MTCMKEKNSKKGRNFYVPDFVSEMLDAEGERYGGMDILWMTLISMGLFWLLYLWCTKEKR